MVRTSHYKYLQLLHGRLCGRLPADSVELGWTYVIDCANEVYIGGAETGMPRRFWIRMIIHRNCILAAKTNVWILCTIVEHQLTVSMCLR